MYHGVKVRQSRELGLHERGASNGTGLLGQDQASSSEPTVAFKTITTSAALEISAKVSMVPLFV